MEDLYVTNGGLEKFTKLDLSHAYHQVCLDDESKDYVTLNTHRGLHLYNRLPFGVNSACGIFQRIMDNLVRGIPGTAIYLDDILVTGRNDEEHAKNLDAVLQRIQNSGLRLREGKCQFFVPEVRYLGFNLDQQGLHPLPDKLEPILNLPGPTCVAELQSFLGTAQYYSRFLPHLACVLAPMYEKLKKDAIWEWGRGQQEAFGRAKKLLSSPKFLVHYSLDLPVVVSADASSYGLGAVISHRVDGQDRPTAFASRTLTKAEKNYSQLDK